jgi:hypothetical protein
VPLVLLKVSIAYVFPGINCPPIPLVNWTVPPILVEVVVKGGFVAELDFNVPLFVSVLLHVNT